MLRTNSKEAKQNIRRYIADNAAIDDTSERETVENLLQGYSGDGFDIVARFLLASFRVQVFYTADEKARFAYNERAAFNYWCSALPSVLDCRHYYKSAVEIAAELLEESPAEAARYTEEAAETFITNWMYDTLKTAAARCEAYTRGSFRA